MEEVPFLRSGSGKTPADGGCVMQVVDWIHSGGWTDRPYCVHPILRAAAMNVNDLLDDDERQKLLDLIPRLMGTNPRKLANLLHGDRASRVLTAAAVDFVLPLAHSEHYPVRRQASWAIYARNCGDLFGLAMFAANAATLSGRGIEFLTMLLDKYDEVAGRERVEEQVDLAPVCEMLAAATA